MSKTIRLLVAPLDDIFYGSVYLPENVCDAESARHPYIVYDGTPVELAHVAGEILRQITGPPGGAGDEKHNRFLWRTATGILKFLPF